MLADTAIADKVLFFLDSDNDLLLGTPPPTRVVFTDYRDLETYVLQGDCLSTWLYGVGKDPNNAPQLKQAVISALKELGLIRVTAAVTNIPLPFAETFVAKANKCLVKVDGATVVDCDKLLTSLFVAAKVDGEGQARLIETKAELAVQLSDRPTEWFVGGKDMVAYLAAVFKMSFDEAYRMLHACLIACLDKIRVLPNFAVVEEFVRA